MTTLKSPYPYFGGKSKVADVVWNAFGTVKNYVEPFFGSGAMLLGRPDFDENNPPLESVNDLDGFISNFWRSIALKPDETAYYADWPISEIDLHARHSWLINRKERLKWSLEDPDFCDPKIAGWWVWGISSWIGSGWCVGTGPWVSNGVHIYNKNNLPVEIGVNGIKMQRPHLNSQQGINRKRPHLTASMGVRSKKNSLPEYFDQLSKRFSNVRVCNGDWSRICGPAPTFMLGLTAVFLDPPYSQEANRCMTLYSEESGTVAHDVRKWAIANGENPLMRIVLCGYDGEHDMPENWKRVDWLPQGGYGSMGKKSQATANRQRERLWMSPYCVHPEDSMLNVDLFNQIDSNIKTKKSLDTCTQL